jgi:hypothetical protein
MSNKIKIGLIFSLISIAIFLNGCGGEGSGFANIVVDNNDSNKSNSNATPPEIPSKYTADTEKVPVLPEN